MQLFAQAAVFAFLVFTTETFFHLDIKAVAEGTVLYLVNDLPHERILQQGAGCGFGYAALKHIEKGCLVKYSDGGAMVALHVVGIDFKHRLGVHTGFA